MESNVKSFKLNNKNNIAIILGSILGIILLVFISINVWSFIKNYNQKADTEYLTSLLSESSELTTAKLSITGITEFIDSGIKFINKSNFIMVYNATVRAGINIDEVVVTADDDNKIIYISIPKAKIQEATVNPSTIKYYNENFSLFNFNAKEDANKAQALAEKEAIKEAKKTGILELADSQSLTLIKGILANAIPDGYVIIVK